MKRAQSRNSMLAVIVLTATASVFVAPSAYATDRMWSGGTSTDWALADNWSGGIPIDGDNAVFDGTAVINQPNLGASATVGGVWMTGAPGQSNTISLSAGTALSINSNTINSIAGLGILVDNSNAQTLTVSAPVTLGAAQTWRNSSGNLFTATNLDTNAQALTIDGTGNDTVSGVISGSGPITLAGTGNVVTFSNAANTFSGQLTVKSGTLAIPTINNASANGTLGNSALPVILGDAGSTGTLHFTGAGTGISSKKFTLATGGTGVFQADDPSALTLSGVIDGGGALVSTGLPSSTLTLQGVNTYGGGTTVLSGSLNGTNSAAFGTGPVTFNTPAGAGGQFRDTVSTPITWTNDFVMATNSIATFRSNGTGGAIMLSGSLTGSGTLAGHTTAAGVLRLLGSISGFQGTFTQNSSNNASLGISFEGSGAANQNGSQAHLILSGVTSGFTNNTVVRFGATGVPTKFGELSGNGGVLLAGTGAGHITLEVGNLITGVNSRTFAGSILNSAQNNTTNTVSFKKVGSGALVLSGTNAYDGSTTVSAGTLVVGADVHTSSTNIAHTSVTANTNDTITLVNHGLVNGDRVLIGGSTVPGGLSATAIYFVRGVAGNTFKLSLTNTDTFIDITSTGSVVTATRATALGADNGAVVLGDGGTTGSENVSLLTGGAFTITRAVNVTNTGSTGVAGIGGISTSNSTFSGLVTLNRDLTVAQNTDGGTLSVTGGLTAGSAGVKTITFGSATVVPVAAPNGFLGAVNVGTVGITDGSGQVAVNVNGNTTTFSAANTYTGNTVVSAGTLALSGVGSFANSPVIQVDSGATLDVSGVTGGANHDGTRFSLLSGQTLKGNGTVSGGVDAAAGSIIAPGASIGTLAIDSLTLASGSLLNFDLGAPSNGDLINVTASNGFTALGGTFNFTNAGSLAAGDYTLIDYSGTLGGAFGNLVMGTQPSGFSLSFINNGPNSSIDVHVAAAGLLGDYNGNNVVDSADYVLWRKGGPLLNDATPLTVGPDDYDFWRAHFGNFLPPGSGSGLGASAAVPEPSFAVLAVLGTLLLSGVRRGRLTRSR